MSISEREFTYDVREPSEIFDLMTSWAAKCLLRHLQPLCLISIAPDRETLNLSYAGEDSRPQVAKLLHRMADLLEAPSEDPARVLGPPGIGYRLISPYCQEPTSYDFENREELCRWCLANGHTLWTGVYQLYLVDESVNTCDPLEGVEPWGSLVVHPAGQCPRWILETPAISMSGKE